MNADFYPLTNEVERSAGNAPLGYKALVCKTKNNNFSDALSNSTGINFGESYIPCCKRITRADVISGCCFGGSSLLCRAPFLNNLMRSEVFIKYSKEMLETEQQNLMAFLEKREKPLAI